MIEIYYHDEIYTFFYTVLQPLRNFIMDIENGKMLAR